MEMIRDSIFRKEATAQVPRTALCGFGQQGSPKLVAPPFDLV